MGKSRQSEPVEHVIQWCPDCDCERKCEVTGKYMIECTICQEPIPLAAAVARNQLRREH